MAPGFALWIAVIVVAIVLSKQRLKTFLYSLGAMIFGVVLAAVLGKLMGFGNSASGTLAGLAAQLFGISFAVLHSWNSNKKAKKLPPPK